MAQASFQDRDPARTSSAAIRPSADVSPDHAEGRRHHARRDLIAALQSYERALARDPDNAPLLYDVARVARDLGNLPGAETLLRRVLEIQPSAPEAINALANVTAAQGRHDEAMALLAPALARDPGGHLFCTMGSLLNAKGDLEQARFYFGEAARLSPEMPEAHANLAIVEAQRGNHAAALDAALRAVALAPDNAAARFNLATIRLALGDFAGGWPDYEARFGKRAPDGATLRPFALPKWDGRPLASRPLLLWAEQGIGEEILFSSMIGEALRFSDHVVVESDPRLVPLLGRSFPGIEAVPRTDPPHPATALGRDGVQLALGSLCGLFRRDIGDFRGQAGYLRPDARRVAAFRSRYKEIHGGPLIGVSWRTQDLRNGVRRTTQLADWLPILSARDALFIDLQYGDTRGERDALARDNGIHLLHDPEVDPLRDLDCQAAQIAALDLVITVQNATVYLGGAVGTPAWAMLPHYRDWRWPVGHAASPWLPTARPFAQDADGLWEPVIRRAAEALAAGTFAPR